MSTYLHPGVYIEEIPSGARPIEGVGTSTAIIIGYAVKGPVGTPELLFNFGQYADQFGGINNRHGLTPAVDYMGHTVQAFFDNGGSKAFIVRLAPGAGQSSAKLVIPLDTATTTADIATYLNVKGIDPGTWADGLEIEFQSKDNTATPPTFTMRIGRRNEDDELVAEEAFDDLTLDETDPAFVPGIVNDASGLVVIDPVDFQDLQDADKQPFYLGSLTSGDLSGLTTSDFNALDGKTFTVTLDGGGTASNLDIAVTLNTPSTLAEVATQIFDAVQSGATTARSDFTCVASNGQLVLTSGSETTTSSVLVAAGTPAGDDGAAPLALIGGDETAVTGEEAFLATFSLGSSAILAGGADGAIPVSTNDYRDTFLALRKFRDVNIVMIPDHQWDPDNAAARAIIDLARKHAAFMKNRMVLIDPPSGEELESENDVKALGLPTSTYTALYYPWVVTVNPHYNPDPDSGSSHLKPTYLVPPSGYAAGVWAKTDGRRGVWKAPAGLATGLIGAARTEFKVGNDEQDGLNPAGVNCYRTILSEPVIWGSRTLATKADPEWRYVPVRRTAMMIEESIFQGIQWAVFEPNDHRLWSSLRLNVETFMDGLHRSGAFQGEKASDAYFVRCGLGDTMTQGDIDGGRVIVVVGFAPLKPAEFVIVRIQQKVAQQ
ncbi:MAG: phage tail sheath family protein [bacterium]|nr:phage tail sheath family protein [bacterium]